MVETTWIFWPEKLHRKWYVEIVRSAKLRQKSAWKQRGFFDQRNYVKKYVETTWIFRSVRLHRKSTWKWRGNSSKIALRRIDVILTSNWRVFDVVCPLGKDKSVTYSLKNIPWWTWFRKCEISKHSTLSVFKPIPLNTKKYLKIQDNFLT